MVILSALPWALPRPYRQHLRAQSPGLSVAALSDPPAGSLPTPLSRSWSLGLGVLVPAFFLTTPPAAQAVLTLLAASAAVSLIALATRSGQQTAPFGRGWAVARLLAFTAGITTGAFLGTGFLVTLALLALLLFLAQTAVPSLIVWLLILAAGALATEAGCLALGISRGLALISLGAALTLFIWLVDAGSTLRPTSRSRRHPAADITREAALALSGISALTAYGVVLGTRAPTVEGLGVNGWFALLLLAFTLWLMWWRARLRRGYLLADPIVLLVGAVTAALTAVAAGTLPGLPLP